MLSFSIGCILASISNKIPDHENSQLCNIFWTSTVSGTIQAIHSTPHLKPLANIDQYIIT